MICLHTEFYVRSTIFSLCITTVSIFLCSSWTPVSPDFSTDNTWQWNFGFLSVNIPVVLSLLTRLWILLLYGTWTAGNFLMNFLFTLSSRHTLEKVSYLSILWQLMKRLHIKEKYHSTDVKISLCIKSKLRFFCGCHITVLHFENYLIKLCIVTSCITTQHFKTLY